MIINEVKEELIGNIIPFWRSLKDDKHGGFYGGMGYDLETLKHSIKGGIYNSRILWFFSNAYITLKDEECLKCADHAYEFLRNKLIDKEFGGVYWSVTYDGKAEDDTKHTYNQAFAIYGLASYYGATGNKEALKIAYDLVDKIENICKDDLGYLEAFDREFKPADNEKLSENGVMASRTMNTLLHVLEAYTELYRVDKTKKVGDYIKFMLDLFADRVYNQDLRRLDVFFDMDWNSIIDLHSYGHDIEASWLVDRACEVLGDEEYTRKISKITKELARKIYSVGLDEGTSLYNECENGKVDTKKVWWVQVEAIIGFVNGYEKDPSRTDYLETARKIWDYTKEYMIDKRADGEWFNELYKDGSPIKEKEIVGPWKGPYHNGRMCLEMINRNVEF
ncbi:MAG TPA: N-acylglucosamine 2-epimerase [Clostridiales bacterium]|nr:N-acylglucosamine 2-epimerase [Clostridiales bacterium]